MGWGWGGQDKSGVRVAGWGRADQPVDEAWSAADEGSALPSGRMKEDVPQQVTPQVGTEL